MLDVATSDEKDDAFKMISDVDMRTMIVEKFDCVDRLTYLFARDLIASMTCLFADSSIVRSTTRFFLIHVTNEAR